MARSSTKRFQCCAVAGVAPLPQRSCGALRPPLGQGEVIRATAQTDSASYAKVSIPLTAVCFYASIGSMSKVNRNNPIRSGVSEGTYSLMEFEREYPDDAACLENLVEWLYPNGIFCPKCEKVTKHHRETNRPSYACQNCGHHEHPMRGTIFQDSATSLKLWFYAIYLMSSTRCGISAKQLERELGVTYKCAWRMFNRIRSMLDEDDVNDCRAKSRSTKALTAERKRTNTPTSKSHVLGAWGSGKQPVWGAVERGGRVVAKVIPDTKPGTLLNNLRERILPATSIFTTKHTPTIL